MLELFDTHAHINLEHYNEDREEIINKMFDEGITKVMIPSVDLETANSAIELTKKYPNNIFASVGFHPTDADKWDDNSYNELKKLAQNKNIVAIGEIGLDYYWDNVTRETQHHVLKEQVRLAKELKLPIIIHTRDSHEDIIKILKEVKANEVGGIFHCFSGDIDFAKQCLELGFYLSFAGNITFKNAQNLRDVAKEVPLEKILIETDSPYLTPMPYRGKRNDPTKVKFVAEKISEIRDIPLDLVIETTRLNGLKVFKIK